MAESSTAKRPRVAAIVLNSVSHDTRVIKQAVSLQEAGHDVTIYGIRDNRCPDPESQLPEGVRVIRIAWRSSMYETIARVLMVLGFVGLLVLAVAYWLLAEPVGGWLVASIQAMGGLAKVLGLGIVLAVGVLLVMRLYRKHAQTAQRYAVLDNPGSAAPQPVQKHTKISRVSSIVGVVQSKVVGLMSKPITPWVRKREIIRAMQSFHPDIIHCHDLSALPIGCAYAKRYGGRVVYDSHEIYEEVSVMSVHRRKRLEFQQRRLSRRVDLFVTINDSIAAYLTKKYPHLPPAVVVKNATRLGNENVSYDGRLHDAAGLDRSTRILLYQGGFSRFRGLSILVKAGPLLPEGWVLVMMGWGTLEGELKALAGEIDPNGQRIRFVPGAPLAELAQWTAGGSLGVIPYENVCLNHWYCTPNKLWEYPIAGVPILASDFPELKGTIEPNGIGRMLPDPLDPKAIADAVAAISDQDLQQMRENCHRFIASDNWSVYGSRLVQAYHDLLSDGGSNAVHESDAHHTSSHSKVPSPPQMSS